MMRTSGPEGPVSKVVQETYQGKMFGGREESLFELLVFFVLIK